MNDSERPIDDADLTIEEGGVAILAARDDSQADAKFTGPCCEKCRAPFSSKAVTICRSCGWYSSLGRFVEVDPKWEAETSGNPVAAASQKLSPLEWLQLIPRWGWLVIGSAFAIVLESIGVRLATADGSTLRTAWSLIQLAIGAVSVICCHIFNFLMLAADDADVGLLDMLLKPFRLWAKTCRYLPKRLWLFNSLVCGLVAVLMSFIVIGGLPYERLWDWGIKEPPKQNLMAAVMDRAKNLNGEEKSLEEAVQDFAGKGDITPDETPPPKLQASKEEKRESTDCVILGYQLDRDGRLEWLVLGTAHRGKLVFAGRVKPKLTDEELSQMVDVLKSQVVKVPFISVQLENVVWVKVKYACRVTFTEQFGDGRLRDAQWDKMLGAMTSPAPAAPAKGQDKKTGRKR
jgi:hypothetical protein